MLMAYKRLRSIATLTFLLGLLAASYLYFAYEACCSRDFLVLRCALQGEYCIWRQPVSPPPSDACYTDNLLVKLGYQSGNRDYNSNMQLLPYYAAFHNKDLYDFPGGLSEKCIRALSQPDSTDEIVDNDQATKTSLQATERVNSINKDCFKVLLSPGDLSIAYSQLRVLLSNFSSQQLEIFISDGSLIGSTRHFGIVPWDDDLDFIIRQDQKPAVRQLLEALSAADESYSFLDTEAVNQHWKVGILCRSSRISGSAKVCRLMLDLFFGHRAGNEWFVREEWPHGFPLGDIYPLTLRPFGPGLLVAAPRRSIYFLNRQYRADVQRACHYQPHGDAHSCLQPKLPCSEVRKTGRHPFVSRVLLPLPDINDSNIRGSISSSSSSNNNNHHSRDVTAEFLVQGRTLLAVFVSDVQDEV